MWVKPIEEELLKGKVGCDEITTQYYPQPYRRFPQLFTVKSRL